MDQSLLWQLVSPKGRVSYLFGTMHIKDEKAFGDMEQVKSMIAEKKAYYSELDLDPGKMVSVYESQILPGNQVLRDFFSERQYFKIRSALLRSFNTDIDRFKQFYPMIIANLLLTKEVESTADFILDQVLYNFALQENKELRYLESAEEQIRIFQEIPIKIQLRSLYRMASNPGKARKQILNLLDDYKFKRTRILYQRSKKQLGALRKVLLYNRNRNMAEKLSNELLYDEAFAAVGAAHLFGYQGILRLMKHKGYRVQAVK